MRVNGCLALLMIGASALLPVPPVLAVGTVLKIATISPEGAAWMTRMRQGADEIERRTQGRVSLKIYPGGIMGSDQTVLRKIRIGQLQGGAVSLGSLDDVHPDSQIYGFPFTFNSFDEVDYVRKRLDERIVRGFEERGFVSFGLVETGFAYLMSSKALRSIDDVKSRKVWIPAGDEISRTAFSLAGISPILLPISDVLTGLETGLIDTIGTPPIAAIALQWFTRVKYLTETPISYIMGTLVIDRKALEKLAPGDQGVVREVLVRGFSQIDAQNRKDNIAALEALRRQGIEFVEPTAQQLAQWKSVALRAREQLIAHGRYSPEIIADLRKHLDTFRSQRGSAASAGLYRAPSPR